jgi:hypothetical protein
VVISQADRTALTLDAYLAARHLVVTPWNERQGAGLRAGAAGLFAAGGGENALDAERPFIIEQSDLLMALPRRAAETMARAARLTIFPLPFPVPRLTSRFTPQRSGKREATRWLISLLQTLGNVAAAPRPEATSGLLTCRRCIALTVPDRACLIPSGAQPRTLASVTKRKTDIFISTTDAEGTESVK